MAGPFPTVRSTFVAPMLPLPRRADVQAAGEPRDDVADRNRADQVRRDEAEPPHGQRSDPSPAP